MTIPGPRLALIAALLRERAADVRALGVRRVRVFGSVARAEATAASDVDVLVEFAEPAGLLTLVRAEAWFEGALGYRTDTVTEGALKSALRGDVLADAVDPLTGEAPGAAPRRKRWRWRAAEMLDAIDRAERYTDGLTLAAFRASDLHVDAVLRQLIRLGETSKFVPDTVRVFYPDVPWADLRAMRNLIAHDYFGVDVALVWHTARVELPALRPALRPLVAPDDA
ncbi:HepT-like ribonuclease domain-containing protein [Deinococcus maricopensis]|uniref:Polymerase nucleotidyl transferase domain-containing protein n=1 Tax=Deinococcus maricopensis (strain DSM 21211 / LMG 22137 / NRRL B-23946 / LB-34) TaxID=709986 RepID=E8U757_DEIML|nr:HepT-like ribonuclease domain-containing protein [Deinococcus maricopensis]ADV66896.1 protein of unknown function DUF86 [Deinococcus maricopensis DSM 21211]